MVQSYTAEIRNMEVRMVKEVDTEINDKVYRKLEIGFDNIDGERIVLTDKNLDNAEKYVRGNVGTVRLKITTENVVKVSKKGNNYAGEQTTILIEDFIV